MEKSNAWLGILLALIVLAGTSNAACTPVSFNCTQSSCNQIGGSPQSCAAGGECCYPFACAIPPASGNTSYCLSCAPNAISCQFNSQCCSGICDYSENSSNSLQCLSCITNANQYASCSADSECCGGLCNLGEGTANFQRCVSCLPQGGFACSGSGQGNCCSGLLCDPFSRNCVQSLPAGANCTSSSQCSSGVCSGSVCQPGCASNGASCTLNSQCCSGACSGGTCISCFAAGSSGCTQGSGSLQCCQDSGAPNVCRPSSQGAYACARCIPSSDSALYRTSSNYCTSSDQCCSGNCDPQAHACVSCRSTGSACTSDTQCCGGSLCLSGTCTSCVPQGYACGSGAPCCAGSYCNSAGFCSTPLALGANCTTSNDCASPLVCSAPAGSSQKACSSCVQTGSGTSCSSDSQCCSGACDEATGSCACVSSGGTCTASSQCCSSSPYCTGTGTQKTCQSCVPYGETASASSQCCSAYRDALSGRCACAPSGSACTANSQCCGGLACVDGKCTAPSYSCSLAPGASCSAGLQGGCCQAGLACSLSSGSSGNCCIPSGSGQFSCNGVSSLCCSGKCEANNETSPSAWRCVNGWSAGHSCSSSTDCSTSAPYCTKGSNETQNTCRSCLPSGSTLACSSGSDCCTGSYCSSTQGTCLSCLALNDTCSSGSDCCSGRCAETGEIIPLVQLSGQASFAPRPSAKKCVPALPSCSPKGAGCSASQSCCASLFCDYFNPQPAQAGAREGQVPAYSCRDCYPAGFDTVCDPSKPCCDSGFTCRLSAIDNQTHCAASAPTGNYVFAGWTKSGSGSFSPASSPVRSGAASLRISGSSDSYIYNARLRLQPSAAYALEFWAYGSGTDTGVRYAIYDPANDAYLAQNGTWSFGTPAIHQSGATTAQFVRVFRSFRTLSSNASFVQVRLYPASNGNPSFVDDLSVTELRDFTIMAWVQADSNSALASILRQLGNESGSQQGISWYFNTTSSLAMAMFSSYGNNTTAVANITDGDWHHLALSVDRAGQYAAYKDGKLSSYGNYTLGRLNASNQFVIGSPSIPSFKGKIDEIRIYGRALSASEIAQQYLGRYQDACYFDVSVAYESVPNLTSRSISTAYNATLRIRRLLPETELSMPFDANSSPAVADYSPFLRQGNLTGGYWTPSGRVGGAYSFNGTGGRIDLPRNAFNFGTGDFSITAWIYPNQTVVNGCGPQGVFVTDTMGIWNEYGLLSFTLFYQLGFARGDSVGSLLNAWTHVAAVRRGGNISIYQNGVMKGSIASSAIQNYSVTSSSLSLIGGSLCSADTFSGKIDEVRVFSKALSESEIRALYNDAYLVSEKPLATSQN